MVCSLLSAHNMRKMLGKKIGNETNNNNNKLIFRIFYKIKERSRDSERVTKHAKLTN